MSGPSDRLLRLRPSGIRRFTALAKSTPGCCQLTIGEPDFDTPEPIKAAAVQALAAGATHYAPNRGTERLCNAISEFETRRGFPCRARQILVTPGATGALYTALTGILNPGDQVIIPTPAFSLYESITLAAGGEPVFLELNKTGFQIDEAALEHAVTPKTRAIVINSPCNPTGCVLSPGSLDAVERCAQTHDLWIICDNVYMALARPDTPDISLRGSLRERLIFCQSFSKPYAMTGWRIGYLIAPEALCDRLLLLQAAQLAAVPTFIQAAAETALKTDVSGMCRSFATRREYVCRRLGDMGLDFPMPEGAFYVFPEIRKFGLGSEAFCLEMIRRAGLAAVPGTSFGCEGHIRISCCYSQPQLEEGLNRLEQFIHTF